MEIRYKVYKGFASSVHTIHNEVVMGGEKRKKVLRYSRDFRIFKVSGFTGLGNVGKIENIM